MSQTDAVPPPVIADVPPQQVGDGVYVIPDASFNFTEVDLR